jgi:short-subunit dehydrogenase
MTEAEERAEIVHIELAPNIAHWMFLPDWQRAYPDAQVFAVTGLAKRSQVQRSGLRIDRELAGDTPSEWAGDVETILVSAPPFAELAVFHRPSRTLVLTDLIQNLESQKMPPLSRLIARLIGSAAPDGRAPIYLRAWLKLFGTQARQVAARLVQLEPERVVFSHGRWFDENATAQLRRSFRWLLETRSMSSPRAQEFRSLSVVVTGASSGIGRATALAFAARGASVVLAARREMVLHEVAKQCAALGGVALVVPTDVTDADAMTSLAAQAVQTFGRIDVWINNAGAGVFGPFHAGDAKLHRRVIDVNLLGSMNGASAALPIFLRQRKGILINNISLGGWAPTPYAAAYTASKFGLRGFTASLRQELGAFPHIHACAVFPSMIDTPGFVHGANVSGRQLDPGPFLYRAEDVAKTIIDVVRSPKDEVAVGWPARAGQLSYIACRGLFERVTGSAFRTLLASARTSPLMSGALLGPLPEGTATDGGWLARKNLPSARSLTTAGVAAVGLIGCAVMLRRRGQRSVRRRERSKPDTDGANRFVTITRGRLTARFRRQSLPHPGLPRVLCLNKTLGFDTT